MRLRSIWSCGLLFAAQIGLAGCPVLAAPPASDRVEAATSAAEPVRSTPAQAIDRLAKQTFKLGGDATFKDIQTMLARIYASGNAARQDALTYALSDIARVYGRN